MNSFNHYAYGAIGDWLYRFVAGIDLDVPGYRHIVVQPHPGGQINYAKAALDTAYGHVVSDWRIKDGQFTLNVEVPPNTHATVRLPGATLSQVRESSRPVAPGPGISGVSEAGKDVAIEIGSGKYEFTYPWSTDGQ
jgi:alpha-L-rhamnosidase